MSEENNDATTNDNTVTGNDASTTDWTDPNIRITVIERGFTDANLEKTVIKETKKD